MDCSTDIFEIIVCGPCAIQCHKGHTLLQSSNSLCRCLHMNPLKNSNRLEETNNKENHPLIPQSSNALRNETTTKESSKRCLVSLNKNNENEKYYTCIISMHLINCLQVFQLMTILDFGLQQTRKGLQACIFVSELRREKLA